MQVDYFHSGHNFATYLINSGAWMTASTMASLIIARSCSWTVKGNGTPGSTSLSAQLELIRFLRYTAPRNSSLIITLHFKFQILYLCGHSKFHIFHIRLACISAFNLPTKVSDTPLLPTTDGRKPCGLLSVTILRVESTTLLMWPAHLSIQMIFWVLNTTF